MEINIILFEPEIAENTGNIARSCVGFNAKLHLIRPYGFFLNDNIIKRSAANYWKHLQYFEYNCFDDFIKENNFPNIYIFTRYGFKAPSQFDFKKNQKIYLMFGKESSGVPKEILDNYKNNLIRIPATNKVRSLNLANCVAIALYEVIKQNDYKDLESLEPHKKIY